MKYSIENDVPNTWDFIIDEFLNIIKFDQQFNEMNYIDDIHFENKKGSLNITYTGGNRITDAYTRLARNLSERICGTCGEVRDSDASVILKNLLQCEKCV